MSVGLQLLGVFAITVAIPALRAGMADAVPAHLRGAGFGAFNLVSILFGAAAAPLIVGALAQVWNLRIAFLVVSPPVYVGAWVLYRARRHLDADAAKIFEAVVRAVQQDQARRSSESLVAPGDARGARHVGRTVDRALRTDGYRRANDDRAVDRVQPRDLAEVDGNAVRRWDRDALQ